MNDSAARKFRPEIQGLRAVAVVSVLIYHVWPTALPGGFVGVDVFFVISGYLITEVLLRDVNKTGSIDLVRFYGRRIKRLLPAATVVLVATGVCYSLLPAVTWGDHFEQIVASNFYYQNWWLGLQAVDYLGAEQSPGPLQHFWSLSVEEQYYFAWPLLFLLAQILFVRAKRDPATVFGWSIAAVFAMSLIHSIHFSHVQPEMAYFASTTRAWELALGGMLAVATSRGIVNVSHNIVLSALGLALIFLSFFVITRTSIFPGYIALLPTVGTALVIAAGDVANRVSVQGLLRTPIFQYLGDISYSLYLWHWPVLIFYQQIAGRTLDPIDALVVVFVSCALAHQTKTLVEDPFRQTNFFALGRRWPFLLGIGCTALSLLGAFYVYNAYQRELAVEQSPQVTVSQAEVSGDVTTQPSSYSPSAVHARKDRPQVDKMGCHVAHAEKIPGVCSFGDENSEVHLVLVGDSHAVQWEPGFRAIAAANKWRLTVIGKSACAFSTTPVRVGKPPRRYDECLVWSESVVDLIGKLKPTHVIVGQSMAHRVFGLDDPVESARQLALGYVDVWRRVSDLGTEILAIRDTPRMPFDVPKCLTSAGKSILDCGALRAEALDRQGLPDPIVLALDNMESVHRLDFSDFICGASVCPAVDDGVLIWRDAHHLTATFVKKLVPAVTEQLQVVMNRPLTLPPAGTDQVDQPGAGHSELRQKVSKAILDRPDVYRHKCINSKRLQNVTCEYGERNAQHHIVLAGDTRAAQWLPALQKLAVAKPLRITTLLTYGCPLGNISTQNQDCSVWTTGMLSTVKNLSPDVLIYSQSRGYRVPEVSRGLMNAQALASQARIAFDSLLDLEMQIVLLPDTPRMTQNVSKCLETHSPDPIADCSVSRTVALPNAERPDPMQLVAHQLSDLTLLDLSGYICPAEGFVCPPVIKDKLVWRSKYLVTASFAETLSEPFGEAVMTLVEVE